MRSEERTSQTFFLRARTTEVRPTAERALDKTSEGYGAGWVLSDLGISNSVSRASALRLEKTVLFGLGGFATKTVGRSARRASELSWHS